MSPHAGRDTKGRQGAVTAMTGPTQEILDQVSQHAHPWCVVCTRVHQAGLGLRFKLQDDGSVEARFACNAAYQGYGGVLHGGIAATLLDGAMTNCLFAHGVAAVTAEMTVRFRSPIEVGTPLTARAWISRVHKPLYGVQAELVQEGQVKATAAGRFMERVA
jgi:uncharacterized protein (TIGR00369 family)